ncbi:Hypothetical predicted protein [Octopus vulgaris]|uniref:Uncharacterized protein n=1 Tax=Octopus vulgaris TaxID=6645 RepID=A0AA36APP8_OCTVU|nr:Hypothetical predicted protein [Octopus vulgaris]
MYKRNIGRREFFQFPCLSGFEKDGKPANEDLLVFCSLLNELHEDVERRFHDLFALRVPDWTVNSFIDIGEEENGELEEELITLQNDIELKPKLHKSDQEFWFQKAIHDCFRSFGRKSNCFHCLSNILFG